MSPKVPPVSIRTATRRSTARRSSAGTLPTILQRQHPDRTPQDICPNSLPVGSAEGNCGPGKPRTSAVGSHRQGHADPRYCLTDRGLAGGYPG